MIPPETESLQKAILGQIQLSFCASARRSRRIQIIGAFLDPATPLRFAQDDQQKINASM